MLNQFYQFAVAPIPLDIWAEISQYLDAKEIEALRLVCAQFNTQMGQNAVWQPLLNRLHAIDPIIRTTPLPNQTCREAFIQGFNKIKKRQRDELSYIKHRIDFFHIEEIIGESEEAIENKIKYISLLDNKIDRLKAAKLIEIESNHIFLDKVNFKNLDYRMFFSGYYQHNTLSVEATRIPKLILKDPFWKNLKKLQIEGILESIPAEINCCEVLEELILQSNCLLELPDTIGELTTLLRLDLAENKLSTLPPSIGLLVALKHLNLQDNRIRYLPNSFAMLSNLEKLLLDRDLRDLIPEALLDIELEDGSDMVLSEYSEDEFDDVIVVTMEDLYEELDNDGYFGDDEKMEDDLASAKRPKK